MAVALVAATAPPADALVAAGFDPVTGTYSVQSDDANDHVVVTCLGGFMSPAPAAALPCEAVTRVDVALGPGFDTLHLGGVPPVRSILVTAADGWADSIGGSPYADVVDADGSDNVASGSGDDRITGGNHVFAGPGDDVLAHAWDAHGEEGDDTFIGLAAGTYGDEGDDRMEVDFTGLGDVTMLIYDHNIYWGMHPRALHTEFGHLYSSIEHLVVTLPDSGTQRVDASGFPGEAIINGRGGPDTIIGSHQPDLLRGGPGADAIDARDGAADEVRCGPDVDRAVVDAVDVVIGCERVGYPDPPPNTSLVRGPRILKHGQRAIFTFSASRPRAVFECKLDRRAWRTCASPHVVRTGKLSHGKHRLKVRAGLPAGNWDASPAVKRFRVT